MRDFKVLIICLVLAVMTLSACGPVPIPESQVLAPIKYDTTSYVIDYANVVPVDNTLLMLYTSLNLADGQAAICEPPNKGALEIVTGIGTHKFPDTHCLIYPTTIRKLMTQQDATQCDAALASVNECIGQISKSVYLLNGAKGTASYEFTYDIVMDSDHPQNPQLLKEVGGYAALMEGFNRATRDTFRQSQTLDPQEFIDGTIMPSAATLWNSKLTEEGSPYYKWEYKSLIHIRTLVVTYFEVEGLMTDPQQANSIQEQNAASAKATEWYNSCGQYSEESYRLECERTYECSLKPDQPCYYDGAVIPVIQPTPTITAVP